MNRLITLWGAKATLYVTAVFLLVVHIGLFALFWTSGVTPMAYFNIFSIAFYASSSYLVYRDKLREFVVATYLEIVVHMTLASYFTGWENGFQVTLIGMYIALFFCEYVGRCLQVPYANALGWGAIGMVASLGVYLVGLVHPPEYALPHEATGALQFIWNALVFGIGMFCLWAFVRLSFQSEAMLTTEASHDALTGLPNRYRMSESLRRAIDNDDGSLRWLAMVDIDDFKAINDVHGHNCGDEVLKAVAGILQSGPADVDVCRWGGEEFLIVGKTDEDMTVVLGQLEKLRAAVEQHVFHYEGLRLHLTITIGVALYKRGESVEEWINDVDEKLYTGKANGKNQVVC